MASKTAINSFAGGQISPLMLGRFDLPLYRSSCIELRNFRPLPYGCAENMPGTEFIIPAKFDDKKARVEKFFFSTTTNFMMEMGEQYIRFFQNGAPIVLTLADVSAWAPTTAYVIGDFVEESGNIYRALEAHTSAALFSTDLAGGKWVADATFEVVTPYQESELFTIRLVQQGDLVYFWHPDKPPQKLTRFSNVNWTFEEFIPAKPPLLDQNTTATQITPSALTGTITLDTNGTGAIFDKDHEGAVWRISHPRTDNKLIQTIVGLSGVIPVKGPFAFFTTGDWIGRVVLERSFDGGTTFSDLREYNSSTAGTNFNDSFTESLDNVVYRLNVTAITSGSLVATLLVEDFFSNGLVRITNVATTLGTPIDTATAIVIDDLASLDPTELWSEGAWSDHNGYPRAATLHQQRQVVAGTRREPQTVRGSNQRDIEDFDLGRALDTDAFSHTLGAGDGRNPIQWIISHRQLTFGDTGEEWILFPPVGKTVTATDFEFRRQSTWGSSDVNAMVVNEAIFFVQARKRKIRAMNFSFNEDQYLANDITLYSENITEGGIVDTTFQKQAHSIYWVVTGDGRLAGVTYENAEAIKTWHDHDTDGSYESIVAIPGSLEDDLWVSVKRTVNGLTKRYIELFKIRENFTTQADNFFVHSGKTFDQGADFNITGATQTDPVFISAAGHPFTDGQQVRHQEVEGMVELNGLVVTVSNPTGLGYEIRNATDDQDINGSGFAAYTGAGFARPMENTFTGLEHLEAKTVSILRDGTVSDPQLVTAGQLTLPEFGNKVQIGLGYDCILNPVPIEVPFSDGTSQTRKKRIKKITLRLHESYGIYVGQRLDNLAPIFPNETATAVFDAPPQLITDDREVPFRGSWQKKANVIIRVADPVPSTILAIIPEIEYGN